MSIPVDVLADDLTGAADTAVAFCRPGHAVRVRLRNSSGGGAWQPAPGARAVDLDVRDAPPELDVSARYRAEAAQAGPNRQVYVKIDSTLRGRVAEAVTGVRLALPGHPVICAPAFPATGRTIRDGVPFVHGVELRRTRIWHAEPRPAPRSLVDVLPAGRIALVPLERVRGDDLTGRLAAAAAAGLVAVCDAVTDDDLGRIARAGIALARPAVWVGSAGLARALAGVPGEPAAAGPGEPVPDRFLAVVGSVARIAHAQVAALEGAGSVGFPVSVATLLGDRANRTDLANRIAETARTRSVVVSIAAGPERFAAPDRAERARIAATLARLVAPAVPATELLLATGGAIARAVLDACSIRCLDVLRELRPGVVLSIAGDRGTRVVTKAGAFGDEHTLTDVLRPSSRPTNRVPDRGAL